MKLFTFLLLLFFALGHAQMHQPKGGKDAFYVYNKKKDTLFFPKIVREGFSSLTFKVEDSIQIDNKKNKEIIISINLDCGISNHGGTFDITKKWQYLKYEIWNLDTKTKIFDFYKSYMHFENVFDIRLPINSKGSQNFSCDFKVNGTEIIISNAKYMSSGKYVNYDSQNNIITPEGTYLFIENEYQKVPTF